MKLILCGSTLCCTAIADLHRQFNGMCLTENDNVAYKPFNKQLRKEAFPHFMQQRVQFAIAQLARQQCAQPPKKLSCFDDILLQDGIFSCSQRIS